MTDPLENIVQDIQRYIATDPYKTRPRKSWHKVTDNLIYYRVYGRNQFGEAVTVKDIAQYQIIKRNHGYRAVSFADIRVDLYYTLRKEKQK